MKRFPIKLSGGPKPLFAYRAVIEFARKQVDSEDPGVKLIFGVIRQAIQDIATEHDPEILESALGYIRSERFQRACDVVGIDRLWLLEIMHRTMQADVDDAMEILDSSLFRLQNEGDAVLHDGGPD